ncbi:golgi apparatus membrane protein tvp15 [Anaeramoeba flamelloides]|uniref:Golgi apparatus membrane protein tvp15 n=1 Tax=Anaeramoeba flamelloides TaxID=1746091 RepID=A0AAV8AJJ0_9EUKA|nr:golgi apparatus membrane protein tvp15 [Anaeramoeba flamelloides]KAJ6241337.1 golgi apparatus membrane protein tvp15 [Anaeramoeba flamelloides]
MPARCDNYLIKFGLSLFVGVAEFSMVVCGIIGIIRSCFNPFTWPGFVLSSYAVIFGMFAIVFEFFDVPNLLKKYSFFRSHVGRGLLAMFVGSLGIAPGQYHEYLLALGVVCAVFGFIQFLLGLTVLSEDIKGTSSSISNYTSLKTGSKVQPKTIPTGSGYDELGNDSSSSSSSSSSSDEGENNEMKKEQEEKQETTGLVGNEN